MFNTISWQCFWVTIAICSTIYYLIVFLLYYKGDVRALRFSSPKLQDLSYELREKQDPDFTQPGKDTSEGIVYACIDELNAFFEEAKRSRWNKRDLTTQLRSIMKKYPSIKTSEYNPSVLSVISAQCEHLCNIHFSDEELNMVWMSSE